jgi:hypothetical protein
MDDYHPHYPTIDNDYYERLTANAHKMANPFRLMCMLYSVDQEKQLDDHYRIKRQ